MAILGRKSSYALAALQAICRIASPGSRTCQTAGSPVPCRASVALQDARAFTTKEPNEGTAYVCDACVCKELGVEDNPQNSVCIDGWRYVPIRLLDIPGLIKDAWVGRGLGNRFLSVIGQADAMIHVVDASGSIDAEGNIAQPGSGNPVQDVMVIEMDLREGVTLLLRSRRPPP